MKKEIAQFIAHCLVANKSMGTPEDGQATSITPIPEWKWENITMDFIVGLPKSPRGNNGDCEPIH